MKMYVLEFLKTNLLLLLIISFVSLNLCACGGDVDMHSEEDVPLPMMNNFETNTTLPSEKSAAIDESIEQEDEALIITASNSNPSGTMLRFDGLYCLIGDSDNNGLIDNQVLRFYGDGDIISVTVEERTTGAGYFPKERWFDKDTDDWRDLTSTYTLDGDYISFTTIGVAKILEEGAVNGTVDYWGTIKEDMLILSSYSNINGYECNDMEYVFYPFSDIPNWK